MSLRDRTRLGDDAPAVLLRPSGYGETTPELAEGERRRAAVRALFS